MGVLALVIGGLSLANTVAAAVFERIRDFGVKRALGASDLQLGREVLGEALAVTPDRGARRRGPGPAPGRSGGRLGRALRTADLPLLAAGCWGHAGVLRAARCRVRRATRRSGSCGVVAGRGDPARCLRRAGLVKTYRAPSGAPIRVLDQVDLVVPAGRLAVVLGPSGCGKSTLLNVLGLLEDADGGDVVSARRARERAAARGAEPARGRDRSASSSSRSCCCRR